MLDLLAIGSREAVLIMRVALEVSTSQWVFVFAMIALVFVIYFRGGVIFNKLFRQKTLTGGKAALEWSCQGLTSAAAEDVLAAYVAEFSEVPQKPNALVGAPYLMRSNDAVVIAHGTLLMESWRIIMLAVRDLDDQDTLLLAHMGGFTTVDGVVPGLATLETLQRRAEAALERFVRTSPSPRAA